MTIKEHPKFEPGDWMAAKERRLEQIRDVEAATKAVKNAWTNAGPYPEYHFRMQASLRDQWPTLANALDKLTETP